jgi:hypothetical protein
LPIESKEGLLKTFQSFKNKKHMTIEKTTIQDLVIIIPEF